MIATPFIAVALTKSWDAFVVGRARSDPAAILDDVARKLRAGMSWNSIWAAAILGAIFFLSGRESWPADFDKDLFPLRIIHQHAGALASARVFTTEQWADYLLYVNYPRQRLYFDDRSLYGAAMMKEYVTILSAGPHWSELADERGLEWMLVPASAGVATALRPRTDWTVADEDAKSVLFRRGQKAR